jgi:SAM-dependent methyltransferase
MTPLQRIHEGYFHRRRTDVLAEHLTALLPPDASVVDVGAGEGIVAPKILDRRPDVRIAALEVHPRPDRHVPVEVFDGRTLPFPDASFDATLLVDVLHHADDPVALLAEAQRVARGTVILKDVIAEGALSTETLHLMERLANSAHGIRMPDTFWRKDVWEQTFERLGLSVESWNGRLGLYPFPMNLVFERRFHFVAKLRG